MQESDGNFFQEYLKRLTPEQRALVRSDLDRGWVIDHLSEQDLALRFENTLRASRAFSWLGVVLNKDTPHGYILDVYLSERTGIDFTELEGEALADSIDYFGDFQTKRDVLKKAKTRLHLIRDSDYSLEALQKTLSAFKEKSGGKQILLCEADLFSENQAREEQSKRLLEVFAKL